MELLKFKKHLPDVVSGETSALTRGVIKLDWKYFFPLKLNFDSPNLCINLISYNTAREFIVNNHKANFSSEFESAFSSIEITPHKDSYYEFSCDHFGYFDGDSLIGVFIAEIEDWSSYYIRYVSILAQYQSLGFATTTYNYLTEILQDYNVKRLTIDVTPSNFPQMQSMLKSGFICTGMSNSDRWGQLMHLTKYIDEKALGSYTHQYLSNYRSLKKSGGG